MFKAKLLALIASWGACPEGIEWLNAQPDDATPETLFDGFCTQRPWIYWLRRKVEQASTPEALLTWRTSAGAANACRIMWEDRSEVRCPKPDGTLTAWDAHEARQKLADDAAKPDFIALVTTLL